ncbi:adenosine deaminase [Candidatus Thorarchaeota archaeon]|nr:MAG: adenosine deaminase [Candidatus Thorarchaeota archaeon]
MNTEEAVKALPKAELHVHILGSVRPRTLLSIMQEAGDGTDMSEREIRDRFRFSDFGHFIEVYKTIIQYVTDERYFERFAFEMMEDCAASNSKYVEVSFSPIDHVQQDLDYFSMIDAIRRGLHRAENRFDIQSDIRIDLVRHSDSQAAMLVLDWVEQDMQGIVSIDIGGSEHKFPPAPFADAYRRASEMGLHLVAHAGEAAGPQSIWDAIRLLQVERIGHGVTAVQDPKLMAELKKRDIVIEACPVSNIRTGAVPSIAEHPIREFYDYGLIVTVNSDDPTLFNTDLNNEFIQLHRHLGFTLQELTQLSLNAVQAAFLEEGLKEQLRARFVRESDLVLKSIGPTED